MVVKRGDVYLVALDPTVGHEIAKTRPAVVISPDEMNRTMGTYIVAPLTSKGKPFPMRVACQFQSKAGLVALDQIRCVDRIRFVRRMGRLSDITVREIHRILVDMFSMPSSK